MAAMSTWRSRSGAGSLRLDISMTCTGESETTSLLAPINNLVLIKFKGNFKLSEDKMLVTISFSSKKNVAAKDKNIKINVSSKELKYSAVNIDVPYEWSEWDEMGCATAFMKSYISPPYYYCLSISVTLDEDKKELVLTKLHTDIDFTDFLLATSEGSIPVHKAYLAAHSDVFKAMLASEWKETVEGQINMKGVTLDTLQLLKDYIYLGTVPDVGLRSLLLIAKCFLMEDLEKQCIRKLAQDVTGQELFSLLEFACENNIPELSYAMLVITQDTVVNAAEVIKRNTLKNKKHYE